MIRTFFTFVVAYWASFGGIDEAHAASFSQPDLAQMWNQGGFGGLGMGRRNGVEKAPEEKEQNVGQMAKELTKEKGCF